MAESPDCTTFLPAGFNLDALQTRGADVMGLYVTEGSKESSEARPDAKDLWWRMLLKCTSEAIAAACFHVHADSMDINGRVGDIGSGTFPIGRCTLRGGFKIANILGPEGIKTFTFDFVAPGATATKKMSVVLCARDKIAETPYFKAKNWREEKCDGAERNLLYATVPWECELLSWPEEPLKGPVEGMMLRALAKADPAKHAEGMVVCEYSRPLYDADGNHTQMLFGIAASSGFGILPGQARVLTGGVIMEAEKLKPATAVCDVSCAVMGPRHRCFRSGFPLLTAEHEGSAACAAKNNGAGKNTKWVSRRGAATGAGSKEKRREHRAGAGAPPMPSQLTMSSADHQREGNIRNGSGGSKRGNDEGASSSQGPSQRQAREGGEPMQQ